MALKVNIIHDFADNMDSNAFWHKEAV
jgi:hypothetical protein